jgi:predicted TIM-barrel fold metal-dependent hydrolase
MLILQPGIVDSHVHVFPPEMVERREAYLGRDARFDALYSSPSARMATAGDLVRHMDETGIAVSVVFGFAFTDPGLCRLVNDYVIEAMQAWPARQAGLASHAPGAKAAGAAMERSQAGGRGGCGERTPEVAGPETFGDLEPVAGLLRERGLPLLVHASEPVGHQYPGKGRFTPEECLAVAQKFPGLKLVFAHMGGGLFLYELMPEVRQVLADVFYDTAAVPYLYGPAVYEVAAASAGPGKLLLGSDYPLLSPGRYLPHLECLGAEARAQIEGANARRLFGL